MQRQTIYISVSDDDKRLTIDGDFALFTQFWNLFSHVEKAKSPVQPAMQKSMSVTQVKKAHENANHN